MKIFSSFSAMCCLLFANGAELSVEGPEGGVAYFLCSHKFAQNSPKYFCKDPCKAPEHTLATVQPGAITGSDRITLRDTGDGAFTVTLSNLSRADSGVYWCAVDRVGIDTYTSVDLRVMEVKQDIYYHSHETTTTNTDLKEGIEATAEAVFEISSTQTNKDESITNTTAGMFLTDSCTNSSQGQQEPATTKSFILYSIVGVVVVFTVIVVVLLSLRKCRNKSRLQMQVRSKPLQFISSNQKQVISQNDMDDNLKYRPAAVPLPSQNQPIYENISFSRLSGNTKDAMISRNNHFPSYVYPLPALPEQGHSVKG